MNIPEGWKLVPVKPTDEMIKSGQCEDGEEVFSHRQVISVYRDMLAAAPTPPEPFDPKSAASWYRRSQDELDSAQTVLDMEPAKPVTYFCNKCGYIGNTAYHKIVGPISPNPCDYLAVADGPWYSADQLAEISKFGDEWKAISCDRARLIIDLQQERTALQAKLEAEEETGNYLLTSIRNILSYHSENDIVGMICVDAIAKYEQKL